jgi:uncharacterized protein (DUF362 family)
MNRRNFISGTVGTSLMLAGGRFYSWAGEQMPDMVAIKGGEPEMMFDRAIKAIGGMGKFVKANQTVVIKPNIGWDVSPERAGNTNPKLVPRIAEHCIKAGAKTVYVFDNTCDTWSKCYSNSGIEKYAKDAGAKVVSGANESYYSDVTVKKGTALKNAKVHELILESDVFINVPILKSHGSTKLTIAMKNLMGIVWDRRYWHRNNLNQCIADFTTYRMPDLNIVDAYRVMKQNGPRGVNESDVAVMKSMIISRDIVASDAAATKLFGFEPSDIDYIKIADGMKLGNMDLNKLKGSSIN